jgi:hypothetical protein
MVVSAGMSVSTSAVIAAVLTENLSQCAVAVESADATNPTANQAYLLILSLAVPSFDMVSLDIVSLDIVSLFVESLDIESFFIESLDMLSLVIVSFFMSSANTGALVSASDMTAADKVIAIRERVIADPPEDV